MPLWTEIGDLMPAHPQSKAQPHLWRWADLLPLAQRAGDLVPVGRGGERRAIALANPALGGRPVRQPDPVGGHPVPDARRGRARAPAHAARLPLRRRGRGRLDRRGTRPGADAPRRLPAAGRLELARAPQRDRQAHGLDRRPRHPVPVRDRGAVLRVRPRRDHRRGAGHAGPLPVRAAVGPPGPDPDRRRRRAARDRRCSPTGGSTPTARSPTSSSWRPRASPASSSPATPSSATRTRAPAPTCCRRSARRCTGSAAAPRRHPSARSARRCTRSSTAPAA